ncbi:MAG: precorrin-6y C5,15-methyltransferase (decarboxylating) subunit CbiE [Bacillota bacterium]|nr:precorrin-6y C5,15-methyltransferase (decarboxylating) subunit CbiE [Bacillota bacterium]
MIKLIGAGPGNIDLLTGQALKAIKEADVLIAFERIGADLRPLGQDPIIVKRVDQVLEEVEKIEKDQSIAIMASGDPCFFGIIDLLKRKGLEIDEVIAGISSVQYLFNRLQQSYSQVATQSVHGRDFDFSSIDLRKTYSFLIDQDRNANYISQKLKDQGYKGKLYCGYNLSYDDEKIIEINIGDQITEPSKLGVVVVEFYVD